MPLRQFRLSPVFTAAAILTLALGIGGTTAIFTLIHAVMLRSLPVTDPARLYRIGEGDDCCVEGGPQDRWGMFSYPLVERLKAASAGVRAGGGVPGRRQQPQRPASRRRTPHRRPLRSEYVTGNYFSTLGVGAFGGRVLTPDDDRAGGAAGRGAQPPCLAERLRRRSVGGGFDLHLSRAIRSRSSASRRRDSSAKRFAATRPTSGSRCSRSRCISGSSTLLHQSVSAWLRVDRPLAAGRVGGGHGAAAHRNCCGNGCRTIPDIRPTGCPTSSGCCPSR